MKKVQQVIGISVLLCVMIGSVFAEETYTPLGKPDQKNKIGEDYYFTYSFDKKPQMGTIIVKIELFNKDGSRNSTLKVTGDAGMPSMKGAHDTGAVEFKLNKAGDYLLPVNVVMPGDWEIKVVFSKDNAPIFRGSIKFDL